jgi:hypothetical protein
MQDNDIFFALTRGVDRDGLATHVDQLRERGYSVFDVPKRDRVDVEIVSPDCIQYWEVTPGNDGRWRLR